MISNNRVIEILKESGVLQEGHFLLSSGRHADKYLQCAQVLQYPNYTGELAEGIASLWDQDKIDVVIGPAIGGIIVSYAVGQALGKRAIFTERSDGKMNLRRSFQIKDEERVLIVEDVVTTGGSVIEVIDLLEERKIYPYRPLLTMDIKTYSPDDCPLCKANIPFTKPGSR